MDAKAAADAAANAGNSGDAEMYRDTAQEKMREASGALTDATDYANMVTAADTERTDLALAKRKAMEASDAAQEAYETAKVAAGAVADSETATAEEKADAQSASVNAKIAARLAKDASDRAQMATESGDAEAELIRAEAHRGQCCRVS